MADEPQRDAEVIVLREADGTFTPEGAAQLGEEGREKAKLAAAKRKAVELHRVRGASLRSALLPKMLTRGFAEGTVNLMFAKILQGEIEPKTAKEAAEVAKIADEIARKHGGAPVDESKRVPERDELTQSVVVLREQLAQRAMKAAQAIPAELGGAIPDGEEVPDVDLTEWDFDPDRPAVPSDDEDDGYAPDE